MGFCYINKKQKLAFSSSFQAVFLLICKKENVWLKIRTFIRSTFNQWKIYL